MGSMRFSEYADSPTIFLPPPSEHSFYPSAHTHFIPHLQPQKPAMQPDSTIPPRTRPASGALQPSPRSSRKRSHQESSEDEAALPHSKEQRLFGSPAGQGSETAGVQGSNHETLAFERPLRTGLDRKTEQGGDMLPEPASPAADEGLEDRRKFIKKEEIEETDPSTTSSGLAYQAPSTVTYFPHDQITLALGIGWKSISADPDTQAAANGEAKFVQNNYDLHDVKMLAKHAMGLCLLSTAEGFHMMREDLQTGVFVTRSWEECVERVRASPALDFENYRPLLSLESRVGAGGGYLPGSVAASEGSEMDGVSSSDGGARGMLPTTPRTSPMRGSGSESEKEGVEDRFQGLQKVSHEDEKMMVD